MIAKPTELLIPALKKERLRRCLPGFAAPKAKEVFH